MHKVWWASFAALDFGGWRHSGTAYMLFPVMGLSACVLASSAVTDLDHLNCSLHFLSQYV